MVISDYEFDSIVREVLGGISYINDFHTNGNSVWIEFSGRRHGAPWTASIDFNDDGSINTVYCQNGSNDPAAFAREISNRIINR
jgi:hypothetical protein